MASQIIKLIAWKYNEIYARLLLVCLCLIYTKISANKMCGKKCNKKNLYLIFPCSNTTAFHPTLPHNLQLIKIKSSQFLLNKQFLFYFAVASRRKHIKFIKTSTKPKHIIADRKRSKKNKWKC
jgi:hypothetical protein